VSERGARLGDVHHRADPLDEQPEPLFGGAQLALEPLALADVQRHADGVLGISVGVPHERHRQVGPQVPAAPAEEPFLHLEVVDMPGDQPVEEDGVGLDVIGVCELRPRHRRELLG